MLGNLVLVVVLLSGAVMVTTSFAARQTARALARSLIQQKIAETEVRLDQFFEPVRSGLLLARSWGEVGLFNIEDQVAMKRLFVPLINQHPAISSLLVADRRGREYMLLRTDDRWRCRQTRRDEWGTRTRWLDWVDGQDEPAVFWKQLDYDPRRRPWYKGAMQKRRESGPTHKPEDLIHWTSPYELFTTKDPGITASVTYGEDRDDLGQVIGFDVLLNDISQFTSQMQVSAHGIVSVLTDDNRVIGLSRADQFATPEARKSMLLKRPEDLGMTLASDAAQAFSRHRDEDSQKTLRFLSEGHPWWGATQQYQLASDRVLHISVFVPESDLLSGLIELRFGIALITLGVLAGGLWRAAVLARQYGRSIESLVRESDRISRGVFDGGVQAYSTIKEVQQLTQAHDRMRTSLQALFKLERDLQLARQIQQSTLPEKLATLNGFQLGAWIEPAEETGGDTFDVIGYQQDRMALLSDDHPDRAVLLLADATGHGIGPALSVTQVRAMLRMAVRSGESLDLIVRHMNEQLHSDLPTGRFITAWLGQLNTTHSSLTSFSAGQGPLLFYDAAAENCHVMTPDTMPLGINRDLEVIIAEPIRMKRGDIFAVFSDGIFDAADADREPFGIDRVTDLILAHHQASPPRILDALREALGGFTNGMPAADDRTAIIVKRG